MGRTEIVRRIVATGVIPVIRAPSADDALAAVEALLAGGLDVVELTMTVPSALKVIEKVVERHGHSTVVGAGTVLDAETARACMLAGAMFVVAPSLDIPTIRACRTHGVPVVPGALTPTEIVRAWRAGADLVKVFPCSAMGGASYIKALRAPLPQIELVPTGGVTAATVGDFIAAGAAAVGAGADLVDIARLRRGDHAGVTENARKYVAAIQQARKA
ncbi:MAG TPA: bifunctional 4-hydroxy-2-oxoglutarate aldolase/2-dehydro-3-deoxy-phosphogluconate aldolase [Kofleriaceae bacterium]|jgi:2-dehydro-3-deoxyphosphogluconate aldolase/(4S)-4-hydroxy-2-oxoglutarate aldolase|nr:bifunctional 4-hydroxy-2-oxoglutarate aldolase/2-dehydro-3-deoxy-phosphogluconate aldolase [Kofleriaceae bacterium]